MIVRLYNRAREKTARAEMPSSAELSTSSQEEEKETCTVRQCELYFAIRLSVYGIKSASICQMHENTKSFKLLPIVLVLVFRLEDLEQTAASAFVLISASHYKGSSACLTRCSGVEP